jgi:trans-aconitate methyltransferase
MSFDFDGDKYQQASKHQKEWGNRIISGLSLNGNEAILDLGCGDGVLTQHLAQLVPNGEVLGIDASIGMIKTAEQKNGSNLSFTLMDITKIDFTNKYDIIFSNAALHWVNDHQSLLVNCKKALKPNGIIRWSFGGFGNCSNLNEVLLIVIDMLEYKNLFIGFKWPWYMPHKEEYTELVKNAGYREFDIILENADRHFPNSDELIKWIDQPCIVPFLDYIEDDKMKSKFRDIVITKMLERTISNGNTYFETFRRLTDDIKYREMLILNDLNSLTNGFINQKRECKVI